MPNMTKNNGRHGIDMPTITKTTIPDSYMNLIRQFPLRRITSRADHTTAKRLVLQLSSAQPDRGSAEYLDVLIDLIADYERKATQALDLPALSPADLVQHRIQERGISASKLARDIGIPQSNLSEMLAGKRHWSKAAIRALSSHLNIRAERFLQ
jgi:HTH-type transcriptional regulator/antitoxin HigA